MREAIKAVADGKVSVAGAARSHGLPKTTVLRHCQKYKKTSNVELASKKVRRLSSLQL